MAIRGFRETERSGARRPVLDATQREVLALEGGENALVLGAPGTGKTTTLVEAFAERVEGRGLDASAVLALAATRTSATRLRDRIASRVGRAVAGAPARTAGSLAFSIVTERAARIGAPAPALLTGAEQDAIFAQLLAGHLEDGTGPEWPEPLGAPVRELRGFRTELRELLMRSTELGLDPAALRRLAAVHGHPEWAAAADFFSEYLDVVAGAREERLDSAELNRFAIAALVSSAEPGPTVAGLRLVLVDDLQEASASTIELLRALAGRGVAVVGFGDPDVATGAFRGGEADVIGRFGPLLGVRSLRTLRLGFAHRHGETLRAMTVSTTARIGTAGVVGQRRAAAAGVEGEPVGVLVADSPGREHAAVARWMRRRRFERDVPWHEMAVVVRGGAQVASFARALARDGVPTRTSLAGRPLREDRAARALVDLVDVGLGRSALTAEAAEALLLGPFGGLDRLALRRLRLALRAEELAGEGRRSADDLVVEALSAPGRLVTLESPAARDAARLAETLARVRARADEGATIEELLWLVWERSGLAPRWRERALATGLAADEANRDLDGVLALFTAAKRFVERQPESGPEAFLGSVLDAEVPEDTLSPQAAEDSVLVTTASGAIGLEFDTVVVAGLQEGVWPNLRVRGSLLAAQDLVRAVEGRAGAVLDERREVLADELRMFALAVSRARSALLLSAHESEDAQSSTLLALVPEGRGRAVDAAWRPPETLRGLTGRLRRRLTEPGRSGPERREAASALARLAAEGVAGADPSAWHGLAGPSTGAPLYGDDEEVRVSPSKLESFEESPLDWFVDLVAGSTSSVATGVGTIVHSAMERVANEGGRGDFEALRTAVWAEIEARWHELAFETPWLDEREKETARTLATGVAAYLAEFARGGGVLLGTERGFAVPVGRALLTGIVDRAEADGDGRLRVVDLKTGKNVPSKAEMPTHAQLGAYQLAAASGGLEDGEGSTPREPGGALLLFVRTGNKKVYEERAQAPFDAEALAEMRDRVVRAADGMARASFEGPPRVEEHGRGDAAARRLQRVRAVSSD